MLMSGLRAHAKKAHTISLTSRPPTNTLGTPGASGNGLFMQTSPVDLCQLGCMLNNFHQRAVIIQSGALSVTLNHIEKALVCTRALSSLWKRKHLN